MWIDQEAGDFLGHGLAERRRLARADVLPDRFALLAQLFFLLLSLGILLEQRHRRPDADLLIGLLDLVAFVVVALGAGTLHPAFPRLGFGHHSIGLLVPRPFVFDFLNGFIGSRRGFRLAAQIANAGLYLGLGFVVRFIDF